MIWKNTAVIWYLYFFPEL
uniref:Uncharacterized protein n=1 Tax=Arundo donax TaxID=35708 RepID=A0A0A9H0K8_ARUDO